MTATDADAAEQSTSDGAPPSPAKSTRRFAIGLGAICGVGLVVRLLNVFWWRPITDGDKALFDAAVGAKDAKVGGDALYYHFQANALAKGAWFVDPFAWAFVNGKELPSAGHPPLPVAYLAVWSRLGLDTVNWHRVALCVLGVAAVALIGLIGRRIGGDAVGLVAAGLAAIYPQLWINDGMLLSETTAIFATALTFWFAYGLVKQPTVRNAMFLGLATALCALSRTEMALLFVVLVLPLTLLAKEVATRERVKLLLVSWVAGALLIAPWVVFNLTRFEEPTFMTSGTGSALSAGSCDEAWYGTNIGYYASCFQGPWIDGDESQRDVEPRRQAIDYTTDHLERLPLVAAARVGRLWGIFKPGQTTAFDWRLEGRDRVASWLGLFAYYVVVGFAIVGLVVMRRRRVAILPLVAVIVVATLAAASTFGVTRYRAPAEVALVLAAAYASVATWEHLRASRRSAPVVA